MRINSNSTSSGSNSVKNDFYLQINSDCMLQLSWVVWKWTSLLSFWKSCLPRVWKCKLISNRFEWDEKSSHMVGDVGRTKFSFGTKINLWTSLLLCELHCTGWFVPAQVKGQTHKFISKSVFASLRSVACIWIVWAFDLINISNFFKQVGVWKVLVCCPNQFWVCVLFTG